jgi:hypothetical protein
MEYWQIKKLSKKFWVKTEFQKMIPGGSRLRRFGFDLWLTTHAIKLTLPEQSIDRRNCETKFRDSDFWCYVFLSTSKLATVNKMFVDINNKVIIT